MYLDRARSWTYKDIEKIVSSNTTEYKNLEFKSLGALVPEAKDEISKDVSSFANSAGGIIIYGIKEVKEGPAIRLELEEGLDPNGPINKEWLENIIVSRISPKIEGVYINPVKLPNEKFILVVVIPQSTTAHMAGNNRYYKRHNFKSEPMEDYEVRDVMNRLDKPRLYPIFTTPKQAEKDGMYRLQIVIRNIGETFVRHFAVRICIPEVIIRPGDFRGGRKIQLDSLWYREFIKQSNPNQYIFPGFRTFLDPKFLPFLDAQATKNNKHLFLYWTLYTDKSGPQDGRTPFEVIIRNRLHMEWDN